MSWCKESVANIRHITLELLLCLLLLCISGLRSIMPLLNKDWLIDCSPTVPVYKSSFCAVAVSYRKWKSQRRRCRWWWSWPRCQWNLEVHQGPLEPGQAVVDHMHCVWPGEFLHEPATAKVNSGRSGKGCCRSRR